MSADNSPIKRSIGLSGVLRWLITIAAVIAIGAAAVAGRFGMAAALAVFVVIAAVLGYRTSRTAGSCGQLSVQLFIGGR